MNTLQRFQIRGELGAGGFATVYRAFDTVLGRDVALKVLHPHIAADPSERERFLRERAALGRLRHPNIVALLDSGEDGERAWHATELVEGRSLLSLVSDQGPLPAMAVAAIAAQLASALAALHARGLIHRDVKPANILIERGSGRAVLLDLGVARDQRRLSRPGGAIVGTPAYMAPEQMSMGGEITERTDVYQLGATLYTLLTGEPPFAGEQFTLLDAVRTGEPRDPRTFQPALPDAAAAVLLQALDRLPALRPAGPRELADALTAALVVPEQGSSLPSGPLFRDLGTPVASAVSALAAPALPDPVAQVALAAPSPAAPAALSPTALAAVAVPSPVASTAAPDGLAVSAPPADVSPWPALAPVVDVPRARRAQGGDTLCAPLSELFGGGAVPQPGAAVQPAVWDSGPNWSGPAGYAAPAAPPAPYPSPQGAGEESAPRGGAPVPQSVPYPYSAPAYGWSAMAARPPRPNRNRWLAAAAGVAALVGAIWFAETGDGARASTTPASPIAAVPNIPGGPGAAPATPVPGGGTVLLRDDFNDPSKGVLPKQSTKPDVWRMGYDGGEYVLEKRNPNADGYEPVVIGMYDNATVTVEARLTGETKGRVVAVICRASLDGWYQLTLDPNTGLFVLERVEKGSTTPLSRVLPAPKVNRGGKNQLSLTCASDQLRARINGVEVARATDGRFKRGPSAFAAFIPGSERGALSARFDNLLVESAKP